MPRIIKNMSDRFDKVARAAKAKSNGGTATDTLGAVNAMFGANFEKIPVGGGMAFAVPEGTTPKAFLAQARGKLVAVSREGEPWAGRKYATKLDTHTNPDKPEVLVMRVEDGDPLPRKTGGRPKGSTNKPKDSANGDATKANSGNGKDKDADTGTTQVRDLTA